ncbi:serine hydrolase [Corynebacterium lactis]|nr:serine hydrolase [Corynebacterium lactis]
MAEDAQAQATSTPAKPSSSSRSSTSSEKPSAKKENAEKGKKEEKKEETTNSTTAESSSAKTSATATSTLKPEAKSEWGQSVQERMDAVTEELESGRSKIGIGILDRKTGEFLCNSHCNDSFELASLSKMFVADVVAYTNYTRPKGKDIEAGSGDMPVDGNQDAMARDDMIRYSDNEATDLLWSGYGGTAIVENIKERYGLSEATQANPDWGMTQSSAADMVAYFNGMLSEKGGLSDVETRYLRQLMYSLPRYSYGDADQNIGLKEALPKEMVANKSGWFDPEIRTTAGFFGDDDRYVIAVLGSYIEAEDLTKAVTEIFPDGEASTEDDSTVRNQPIISSSSNSSKTNPAIWAILAAIVGFLLGWIVRKQTSE